MSYLDAFILGALQGLTEFLPVSSSGHLVLVQALLGVKQSGVAFELLVHLGSLMAVFIYFRRQIYRLLQAVISPEMKSERKIILFLIIGTVPAGLIGVLFDDFLERAFSSPGWTSIALIATGLILLSTRLVRKGDAEVGLKSAILIGLGQALAIFPGISRSGSTIASGMLIGVSPAVAAEFSFLLAIPAIGGAVLLKSKQLLAVGPELAGQYMLAVAVSFIFSLVAVYLVLEIIRRGKFEYFAYYCFAAGTLGLYLFL